MDPVSALDSPSDIYSMYWRRPREVELKNYNEDWQVMVLAISKRQNYNQMNFIHSYRESFQKKLTTHKRLLDAIDTLTVHVTYT